MRRLSIRTGSFGVWQRRQVPAICITDKQRCNTASFHGDYHCKGQFNQKAPIGALNFATTTSSSPFDPSNHSIQQDDKSSNLETKTNVQRKRKRRVLKFVPLKPAVNITPRAQQFFLKLLHDPPRPTICGVRLNYDQSSSGQPRMVFSFSFVTPEELDGMDEAVPLEKKTNDDAVTGQRGDDQSIEPNDTSTSNAPTVPTLYVSANAFLKVLGSTVDIDENFSPILYDKEGNRMDPNA